MCLSLPLTLRPAPVTHARCCQEEHDDLLGGLRHHHTGRPGLQSGGAMDALQSALRETGLRYDNPSAASTPSRGHSRPAYAPAERAPAEAPLWDAAYRASHRQPAARRQPGLDSLWQEPGGGDKGGGGGAGGDDALEAAVVARVRKAEVLGQQMTLPEDIVQVMITHARTRAPAHCGGPQYNPHIGVACNLCDHAP